MRRLDLALALGAVLVVTVLLLREHRREERTARPVPETVAEGAPDAAPPPPDTPAEAAGEGIVEGVVTGKYGGLWGARVVARLTDGRPLIATETAEDGSYRLTVPAGTEILVEATAGPETGLEPHGEFVALAAGERRTLDLALADTGSAGGLIVWPEDAAPTYLRVLAIPLEGYPMLPDGEAPTLGLLYQAPGKESAQGNAGGRFTFAGLGPGPYRLEVDSPDWMLDRAVVFERGDADVRGHVVRALNLYVEARDAEDRAPLAAFEVTLAGRTFAGRDGVLRVRRPFAHAPDEYLVRAEGYYEERTKAPRVFLQRVREPNVTLRATYEDGQACTGTFEGTFEHAEGPDGKLDARIERTDRGLYRAVLPPGRWRLVVKPRGNPLDSVRREVEIEVAEGDGGEVAIVLRRGGTIILRGGPDPHLLLRQPPGGAGKILDVDGEVVIEEVPPGLWWAGTSEVFLEAGGVVTIAVPRAPDTPVPLKRAAGEDD